MVAPLSTNGALDLVNDFCLGRVCLVNSRRELIDADPDRRWAGVAHLSGFGEPVCLVGDLCIWPWNGALVRFNPAKHAGTIAQVAGVSYWRATTSGH